MGPLPTADRVYMRPPVRFVHDVASTLIQHCKLFHKMFTEEQLDYAQLTSKEARLEFFDKLIAHTWVQDGMDSLELSAQDILTGKNTSETSKFLQFLAYLAIQHKPRDRGGLADVMPQWTTKYTIEYSPEVAPAEWFSLCS